jgi:hypothetical protein
MSDIATTAAPPLSLASLPNYPYLLTITDVATLARCSTRHVMNKVEEGVLAKVPNLGRSVRFDPLVVLRFLRPAEAVALPWQTAVRQPAGDAA